ncbi:MAG: chorismate mutase [Actinomycetota bacterium]
MPMRGFRGATMLQADDAEEMAVAVVELVNEMLARNGVSTDDLVSILFTATPDLHCAFPAASARTLGLQDVPLICAQELDIDGAAPRVVRVLVHAESTLPRADIQHVYLRGAEVLRQDLAT